MIKIGQTANNPNSSLGIIADSAKDRKTIELFQKQKNWLLARVSSRQRGNAQKPAVIITTTKWTAGLSQTCYLLVFSKTNESDAVKMLIGCANAASD